MRDYSAVSLLRRGLTGHRGWRPAWRKARPKPAYDAVIVGGGGHGLATAYYLARRHGMRRIAVLEKGWLGGGNTGRNTTAVRSNYFYPESVALYDLALRLYEGLSRGHARRAEMPALNGEVDADHAVPARAQT
jgi:sarcosine oxidase subunit beta